MLDSQPVHRLCSHLSVQGVLFTFGAISAPVPAYTGTVAVVTGDKDFIFWYAALAIVLAIADNACCSEGNCYAVPPNATKMTSILDSVQMLYPAASNFTTYLPVNTGSVLTALRARGGDADYVCMAGTASACTTLRARRTRGSRSTLHLCSERGKAEGEITTPSERYAGECICIHILPS
jgi:hypothetical protein